jgi:hypothetical protein
MRLLEDMANAAKQFVLSDDLNEGLKLIEKADVVIAKKEGNQRNGRERVDRDVNYDVVADDVWKLSNKVEKGLVKYSESQSGNGSIAGKDSLKELDYMKRMLNKMKQEIDDRDEEIRLLRSNNRMR